MERRHVTWSEFHSWVFRLVELITHEGRAYGCVVGVVRGGYVPAVCLSHLLGLPFRHRQALLSGDRPLFVDDISDTGATLFGLGLDPDCDDVVTLVHRQGSLFPPRHAAYVEETDAWFVFPWERGHVE